MALYLLHFLFAAIFVAVLTFLSFGFFIVLTISRKLGEPDVFQFRML